MEVVARVRVDPARARIYEHGWQSWSPSGAYRLSDSPPRPRSENSRVMNYRGDRHAPADTFWGEGLLALDPGDGSGVWIFSAPQDADPIPSIRADVRNGEIVVSADGPVEQAVDSQADSFHIALGRWAHAYADRRGFRLPAVAPTAWCSWYQYFTGVTEADVLENLVAMDDLGLDIDVVQIDDGYQREIGDWLTESDRFASLEALVGRIRETGRRAGIWVAPFLVSPRSATYRAHPDWVVGDVSAGANWDAEQYVLDVTRPAARRYLRDVFERFREMGFDFFKIDFVYAGALPGRRYDDSSPLAAYRMGLETIRGAVGPESFLLGCGAPILPSVGLVDAMRISPDTSPHQEPESDLSMPSALAATLNGRSRAWQHGRFWANDPDCIMARPAFADREDWAQHIARFGGLRVSSDRLRDLDAWGLETTRALLQRMPIRPFDEQSAGAIS